MDLDNINDIELLKDIAKSYMIQMKQDTNAMMEQIIYLKKDIGIFLINTKLG